MSAGSVGFPSLLVNVKRCWIAIILNTAVYIDGGSSYIRSWFPSFFLSGVFSCHRVLSKIQTSTLFICSETQRGYREAGVSDGSFKLKLMNLEFRLT